jgi:hypothetical protein
VEAKSIGAKASQVSGQKEKGADCASTAALRPAAYANRLAELPFVVSPINIECILSSRKILNFRKIFFGT